MSTFTDIFKQGQQRAMKAAFVTKIASLNAK